MQNHAERCIKGASQFLRRPLLGDWVNRGYSHLVFDHHVVPLFRPRRAGCAVTFAVAQWSPRNKLYKGRRLMADQPHQLGIPLGKLLEEEAVQEFATNLRVELLRPEDDGYDAARRLQWDDQ